MKTPRLLTTLKNMAQEPIQIVSEASLQSEFANVPINYAPSPNAPPIVMQPTAKQATPPTLKKQHASSLPRVSETVEIPVAVFQMIKVSSGGSRQARLVRLDPICGRILIQTRQLIDTPIHENGYTWRIIEFERVFEVRRGITTKDFQLGARPYEQDRCYSLLYLENGSRTEVNLSSYPFLKLTRGSCGEQGN